MNERGREAAQYFFCKGVESQLVIICGVATKAKVDQIQKVEPSKKMNQKMPNQLIEKLIY